MDQVPSWSLLFNIARQAETARPPEQKVRGRLDGPGHEYYIVNSHRKDHTMPATQRFTPDPVMDEKIERGFKIGDLRRAFDQIANKENWKYPISCWIKKEDFDKCNAAAIFFAGSPLSQVSSEKNGMIKVYGDGYYNCIGA